MNELGRHDADGGHVLELSLHDVEMLVESPGLVRHGQEEDPEKVLLPLQSTFIWAAVNILCNLKSINNNIMP